MIPASQSIYDERGGQQPTTTRTPKELILKTIQGLPDDSSFEQLLKELAFELMVERGLADSNADRTISHEEMGRRIDSWGS